MSARSTPPAPAARASRTATASATPIIGCDHDADLLRLQEPRQPDLAHHAGHDGLLHLLARLPSGRCQPLEQRRGQDRCAIRQRDCRPVGPDASPNLVKQYNKPYTYAPDSLTNNEIGFKTRVPRPSAAGQRLGLQHGVEQRADAVLQPADSATPPSASTGPNYRIKGGELQIVARVTDGLTLQGSISHNNATETNSPCLKSSTPAVTRRRSAAASRRSGRRRFSEKCLCRTRSAPSAPRRPSRRRSSTTCAPATTGNVNDYKIFFTVGAQHVGDM